MRVIALSVLLVGLVSVFGCGGGSSGGEAGADLVTIQGTVLCRDGDTHMLSGIEVFCPESGDHGVTDGAGGVEVHVHPDVPFHLDFDDPMTPADGPCHGTAREGHDPMHDGAEIDGNEIAFGPVGRDETCEVEVCLEHGEVVEFHMLRSGPRGEFQDGEQRLGHDEFCDGMDAVAEIEIEVEGDCLRVEIDVDGIAGPQDLSVYLVDREGTEAFLATLPVDADGEGHLELTWCEGDALPFGAESPEDLAGYGITVYDEAEELLFVGHLPHHHPLAGEGHHHDDEDPSHHGGGPMGPMMSPADH
jgi:hypothetical protein